MSDRVDLIRSFHEAKRHDDLAQSQRQVHALYLSLNPREIDQVIRTAVELLVSNDRVAESILRCLACFHPGCLGPAHLTLLERRIFYPAIMYYGAEDRIADRILSLLSDEENVNHMLLALAWIGNETVQKAFQAWKKEPPNWVRGIHLPPHRYAEQAGWMLTPRGKRKELCSTTCHPLIPPADGRSIPDILRIGGEAEEVCRWCNRSLTVFLDLDLSRQELSFLNINGKRLRILTCPDCTCFGCIYTKVDWNGNAAWHKQNEKPGYLPEGLSAGDTLPLNPLAYCGSPRHALEGADCSLPGVAFSQIGGWPTWIQDAHYPPCPECESPMPFLAQLSNEDFQEYGEGIYFIFLCEKCKIAATAYQQS